MNATEVERLVRDVIVHGGLPFTRAVGARFGDWMDDRGPITNG